MATKNVTVSDLSGEPDATTFTLGVNSEWRAVDLTEAERAELDALLKPYLAVSRRSEQAAPKPTRNIPATTFDERVAIRRWGHANGFELADRGIIPKAVYQAFQAAHGAGLP